jgi:hypothetical protein
MADKRTTPETPKSAQDDAGPRRKKRLAPTIDLTATEMPTEAAATGQTEPPPSPPRESTRAERPPSGYSSTSTYGAGAAGALAMTVILFGLWLTGLLPVRYEAAPAAVPQPNSKAVDAIAQRVGKIEDMLAKLPPSDAGVAERLAAAENAMKSLGVALAALNKRSDDVAANAAQALARTDEAMTAVSNLRGSLDAAKSAASTTDIEALQQRIAALEQSAKAAHEEIAKTSSADVAGRRALSAAALRDAVASGASFAAELAQAKALGADEKMLTQLSPFASSGVPSVAALAQELRALLPVMVKIAGAQTPEGGFIERLQANAGKIVRIRPVDAPPGDDATAVLARLEVDAAKTDLGAALADLGKLPEAVRAPAQGWIAKAQAGEAALKAARQYAADAARALGTR